MIDEEDNLNKNKATENENIKENEEEDEEIKIIQEKEIPEIEEKKEEEELIKKPTEEERDSKKSSFAKKISFRGDVKFDKIEKIADRKKKYESKNKDELIKLKNEKKKEKSNLESYKKILFFKVIFVLFLCFVVVLERIFYYYVESFELQIIPKFQKAVGPFFGVDENYNTNFFHKLVGKLSSFQYILLFYTHFYITIFVGVDALVSIKIMIVHYFGYYLINLIDCFYKGPRPFWLSRDIIVFECLKTYGHPSDFVFSILFFFIYSYQSYLAKSKEVTIDLEYDSDDEESQKKSANKVWIQATIWILTIIFLFICFTRYLLGLTFIINLLMAIFFIILYFIAVHNFDSYFDGLVKRVTIMKLEAKKSIFYWLMSVIGLQVLGIFFFKIKSENIKIDWISNLNKNYHNTIITQSQLFDWTFALQPIVIIIALLGGIFGVAKTFGMITNVHWYKGSFKLRLIRIIIANAFVIPSWFVTIYQDSIENSLKFHGVGLTKYLFNSFHYFLLYYILFGIIPYYIFHKFRLTSIDLKHSMLASALIVPKYQRI